MADIVLNDCRGVHMLDVYGISFRPGQVSPDRSYLVVSGVIARSTVLRAVGASFEWTCQEGTPDAINFATALNMSREQAASGLTGVIYVRCDPVRLSSGGVLNKLSFAPTSTSWEQFVKLPAPDPALILSSVPILSPLPPASERQAVDLDVDTTAPTETDLSLSPYARDLDLDEE